jgi:hypothetical protein
MWATRRMNGRGRFQGGRRSRLTGHARRAGASALLALMVFLLLALADAAGAIPSNVAPLRAHTAHAAPPPTITIVDPNPPQGTGGTQLTVTGSGFTPGPMALNADSRQDCSVLAVQVATANVDNSGNFNTTFTWPKGLPPATYYICATGVTQGQPFTQIAPPSLTLVNPTNGQGPVGTHVTLSGTGFQGTQATIFAATDQSCQNQSGPLGTVPLNNDGTFTRAILWPLALGPGSYYICGNGMTASAVQFQVISSNPPTLSLSTAHINAGDPLTVTGTNFNGPPAGTQVTLLLEIAGGSINLPGAAIGPDGSFTTTLKTDNLPQGSATLLALAEQTGNADAALQATAGLDIGQASTPTPSPSPSPSPTAATSTTAPPPQTDKGSGGGGILLIVLAIVVVLLGGLGAAAYFLLRQRGEPGPGGGFPGGGGGFGGGFPGGGSGFGGSTDRTVAMGPYGSPYSTSRPGMPGQPGGFSRSGMFDAPAPLGGVSQWDETDTSQPDPTWQPRPMTGRRPYDAPAQSYPPDDATLPRLDDVYGGPADPWAGATTSGQDDEVSPPGGTRGGPGYPSPQPRNAGWDDGGWERTTRPGDP